MSADEFIALILPEMGDLRKTRDDAQKKRQAEQEAAAAVTLAVQKQADADVEARVAEALDDKQLDYVINLLKQIASDDPTPEIAP